MSFIRLIGLYFIFKKDRYKCPILYIRKTDGFNYLIIIRKFSIL
jgi:hypothetical protein